MMVAETGTDNIRMSWYQHASGTCYIFQSKYLFCLFESEV